VRACESARRDGACFLEALEEAAGDGVATMVEVIVASPQFREIRGRDMLVSGVAP
jgi:hypothetical protein